jgi:hypothetical protein
MRRIRLLAAVVVLGLTSTMLGMAAVTAPAASAQPPPCAGTSYFCILNVNSHLCLGIAGGKQDAEAVQYTCEAVANQEWYLGGAINDIYTQLRNLAFNGGQCLGVAGGNASEGAEVVGWSCLGTSHPDLYWWFTTYDGVDPLGFIENYKGQESELVLGVAGGSKSNGAEVVLWPASSSATNQQWDFCNLIACYLV